MGATAAKRLATTAYLWSLTRDVPGVPASTLIGGVLVPGDDPNVLAKALDNLEASAWYLHCDARGYRFSVEPSLAKLVLIAAGAVHGGAPLVDLASDLSDGRQGLAQVVHAAAHLAQGAAQTTQHHHQYAEGHHSGNGREYPQRVHGTSILPGRRCRALA